MSATAAESAWAADHGAIPSGLCPLHREHVLGWRDNDYDLRSTGDWPAGRSTSRRFSLMDSRTKHEERVREFAEKNRRQIDLIVSICRSGRSPQCDHPAVTS